MSVTRDHDPRDGHDCPHVARIAERAGVRRVEADALDQFVLRPSPCQVCFDTQYISDLVREHSHLLVVRGKATVHAPRGDQA